MILIGAGVEACINERSAFCACSHEFEKIGGKKQGDGVLASVAQYLFLSQIVSASTDICYTSRCKLKDSHKLKIDDSHIWRKQ